MTASKSSAAPSAMIMSERTAMLSVLVTGAP
jgi:hypothetical protein